MCSSHKHEFTRLCCLFCVRLLVLFPYETAERCHRLLEMSEVCFSCLHIYPIGCFVINRRKGTKHTMWSLRAMHIDGTVFYYVNLHAKEKCYVLIHFSPFIFNLKFWGSHIILWCLFVVDLELWLILWYEN